MSCCADCAERDRAASFGATPGWDDYLGPLRHGYPPLFLPYGQSFAVFGQIAGPPGILVGVEPFGANGGGGYRPPAYAYFGRHMDAHVRRGRELGRQMRGARAQQAAAAYHPLAHPGALAHPSRGWP